jgi:hypothetical protein
LKLRVKMLTSAKIGKQNNGDTRTRKPEPGYLNFSIMSNYDRWLSFISLWFEISLKIVIKVLNLIINNLYKFPSKLFSFSLFQINVYIELN